MGLLKDVMGIPLGNRGQGIKTDRSCCRTRQLELQIVVYIWIRFVL